MICFHIEAFGMAKVCLMIIKHSKILFPCASISQERRVMVCSSYRKFMLRYSNVLVAILTLTYVLALIWFLSSHSLSKWERVHITCSFSINFVRELIGLYLHIVFNHFAAGSNILGSLLIAFYRPIHTGKIHSRTRRK